MKEDDCMKNLLMKSRSYRGFDHSYQFTYEQLYEYIDCIRYCPSTLNLQPLKYYLAYQEEDVAKIQAKTGWARNLKGMRLPLPGKEPTAFIVICQDTTIEEDLNRFKRDVGIVAQSILLCATEEGLGGCMIGSFSPVLIAKELHLKEHIVPQLIVALGKPDEEIQIVDVKDNQTEYYRDENGIHYVPKRKTEDMILSSEDLEVS